MIKPQVRDFSTLMTRDYYLQRGLEEEKAALSATSLKARRVHEELARLYLARADALGRVSDAELADLSPSEDAAA
jgi:hypothetical protein